MKTLIKSILFTLSLFLSLGHLTAQCENWVGQSFQSDAEDAHSIYRQALKSKDYTTALEYWQKAYDAAPTADGVRDVQFTDGVILYSDLLSKETDEAKKAEYKKTILDLYNGCVACYEADAIKRKNCKDQDCYNQRMGYIKGRQGFDMYYTLNSPYSENLEVLKSAVELAGNKSEYIVFTPMANITVYQFQKDLLSAEEARKIHIELNEIADYNIANNKRYGPQYQQAKDAMNASFAPIERDIFDCEFFKNKLRPEYEADPDNPDVIKRVLAILKGQGCEKSDALVTELDVKWKKYATAENARLQAEFEANNPSVAAKKLYDTGDYAGAIEKYNLAIQNEVDTEKKASYKFSVASIQFRKLKQYSAARATAREAASLKPGWGRPYMLIGDMYASSAGKCGDSWNQRLAIIAAMDKYNYAKSIDPSVSEEAGKRIGRYQSSLPLFADGHMRGVKKGDKAKVGCWIGETVSVRYGKG